MRDRETLSPSVRGVCFLRAFFVSAAAAVIAVLLASCSTPQERSGYNPKPFNSPAEWEYRPYGDIYRN